ncbi:MAG: helix-turn-helix domain-containing protein [Faecousia sp.]
MSQCERILWHMRNIGPINPLDAIVLYGCTQLRKRIYDLRQKGYSIESRLITYRNRFGEEVKYSEYFLNEKF